MFAVFMNVDVRSFTTLTVEVQGASHKWPVATCRLANNVNRVEWLQLKVLYLSEDFVKWSELHKILSLMPKSWSWNWCAPRRQDCMPFWKKWSRVMRRVRLVILNTDYFQLGLGCGSILIRTVSTAFSLLIGLHASSHRTSANFVFADVQVYGE